MKTNFNINVFYATAQRKIIYSYQLILLSLMPFVFREQELLIANHFMVLKF